MTKHAALLFMNSFSNERLTLYLLKYWHGNRHNKFWICENQEFQQIFIVAVLYDIHCYFSDISVSCEDVTGSVGKEVNLTCSVSLLINKCCIKNYMFEYKDSKICPQVLRESCERRKSVTCSYTPTTTVTEKFSFFVQASCGWKKLSFTVDTTGTAFTVTFLFRIK